MGMIPMSWWRGSTGVGLNHQEKPPAIIPASEP